MLFFGFCELCQLRQHFNTSLSDPPHWLLALLLKKFLEYLEVIELFAGSPRKKGKVMNDFLFETHTSFGVGHFEKGCKGLASLS